LPIEASEVVTPQGIARFNLLHSILYIAESSSHLIQNLLVEQLHAQAAGQLGANLMPTSAKLSADGYNKFLLPVHNNLNLSVNNLSFAKITHFADICNFFRRKIIHHFLAAFPQVSRDAIFRLNICWFGTLFVTLPP
jgi:hypothetical protein